MKPIIVLCLALVFTGAIVALRWGHLTLVAPWVSDDEPPAITVQVKRFVWFVDVLIIAAIGSGLLVIGPGGRLVMRLLAATAGDDAQGKVTEAEEIVGKVTTGGTISLVLFVGLFGGLLLAATFGLLRKWLPSARLGALAVAGTLALTLATRGEPLRPENPDFDIVGPDWLAVATFAALGVLSCLTFGALAGRVARSLPLLELRPGAIAPYAPLLLLIPSSLGIPILVAGGAIGIAFLRQPQRRRTWADRRLLIGGRIVLALAAGVLLPAFVSDLTEIL